MDTSTDPFWTSELRDILIKKLNQSRFADKDIRQRAVERLPLTIQKSIERVDRSGADIAAIVAECARYPEGISKLIRSVQKDEEETIWNEQFNTWLTQIEWKASDAHKIPYVVAAMTQDEAQQLPNVIADAGKRQAYETYLATLQQAGVELVDIKAQYKATRSEWEPHLATEQDQAGITKRYHERAIRLIVEELFEEFNQRPNGSTESMEPDDFTNRLLPNTVFDAAAAAGSETSKERMERAKMARYLEQGCMLFIDPLSLFHPTIYKGLQDAAIISIEESVAVLLLTPVTIHAIQVHWMVNEMLGNFFPRTLVRRPSDPLYECGIDEIHYLKRRLAAFLGGSPALLRGRRPAPGNEDALAQRYGRSNGAMAARFRAYR